ncbi:ATP-binding protein [Streptomyces sp. NPDC020792]|uniref:ATP-binding protein n=1 Tax=Streptomyces sp. NPDC020792 TaxID=3365089 RepID=UPI0037BA941D
MQLVISELVTNARKYAPGPCMLILEVNGDAVGITVWDSEPKLPTARAADPGRVGQHGLEVVLAVSEGFTARREPVKRITAGRRPRRQHRRPAVTDRSPRSSYHQALAHSSPRPRPTHPAHAGAGVDHRPVRGCGWRE